MYLESSYLNNIKNERIKEFTRLALEKYGSSIKLKKSNKVADIVWKKFITLGYITPEIQQQFVDMTISAALLYNLFYRKEDITTILKHRVKLKEIREESGLDERIAILIYELIEGQLGDTHSIQKFKPAPNSPGYTLAEAIWYVDVYPFIEE